MKVVATIEARMTSTRLPGKVMMPALGEPMMVHLFRRLKAVESLDAIVLATTTNSTDDVLEDVARKNGIEVFRGSESDVLGRVVGAARSHGADVVVEISGDCPVIDPDLVEQTVRIFLRNPGTDFASNAFISSYPGGMDTSVFAFSALEKAAASTDDPHDREHVAQFVVNRPELFSHLYVVAPPSLHWPDLHLLLDERSDYDLLVRLFEHFGRENTAFSCGEIIGVLRKHPEWLTLNDHVKRNNVRPR